MGGAYSGLAFASQEAFGNRRPRGLWSFGIPGGARGEEPIGASRQTEWPVPGASAEFKGRPLAPRAVSGVWRPCRHSESPVFAICGSVWQEGEGPCPNEACGSKRGVVLVLRRGPKGSDPGPRSPGTYPVLERNAPMCYADNTGFSLRRAAISGRHDPHSVPAPQRTPTAATVSAPALIDWRMSSSETARH